MLNTFFLIYLHIRPNVNKCEITCRHQWVDTEKLCKTEKKYVACVE